MTVSINCGLQTGEHIGGWQRHRRDAQRVGGAAGHHVTLGNPDFQALGVSAAGDGFAREQVGQAAAGKAKILVTGLFQAAMQFAIEPFAYIA